MTCCPKPEPSNLARHRKTGILYEIVAEHVINATNSRESERLVLYRRARPELTEMLFARETGEFEQKFVRVEPGAQPE